ncbi:hypothetical protein [Wolbachia endosymbiont (group A) of Agelastica alni]|uniref:hypothetical protein n=1 Tax=Wolbachia endosymbiont (group A) of Agelastica alni TaxID=3066130 RepID=UPI00313308A9
MTNSSIKESIDKKLYKELLVKQLLEKVHKKHTPNSEINVTFSSKVSRDLVDFSEAAEVSVQETANKLMLEIISLKEQMMEFEPGLGFYFADKNLDKLDKSSGINVTFNRTTSRRLERLAEEVDCSIQILAEYLMQESIGLYRMTAKLDPTIFENNRALSNAMKEMIKVIKNDFLKKKRRPT